MVSHISVDWSNIYETDLITKVQKSTDQIDVKTRETIRFNAYLNHRNIYKFVYTTQDIYRRLSPYQKNSML